MGHTDIVVAANERGERDGFGRGKGRIPTGTMLHGLDGLAVRILVFIGGALANKLLAGGRMLALAEFGKVLGGDRSGKAELRGKPALPFAGNHAALGPIVLLLRGELLCVVALRLPCGKRLGNGQHGGLLQLMSGRLDLMLREHEDCPAFLPALPGEACLARSDRPFVAHRSRGFSLRAQ